MRFCKCAALILAQLAGVQDGPSTVKIFALPKDAPPRRIKRREFSLFLAASAFTLKLFNFRWQAFNYSSPHMCAQDKEPTSN